MRLLRGCLLLSVFSMLTGCVTYEAYTSDIDAERKVSSSTTHLIRILGSDEMAASRLGIAVLVGVDSNAKSYVALARALSGKTITNIRPDGIRSIDYKDAEELLRVVEFSIENYDKLLSKTESINATFHSHLQSKHFVYTGGTGDQVITDVLNFDFANKAGYASTGKATLSFGTVGYAKVTFSKKKLQTLKGLLLEAINQIKPQDGTL